MRRASAATATQVVGVASVVRRTAAAATDGGPLRVATAAPSSHVAVAAAAVVGSGATATGDGLLSGPPPREVILSVASGDDEEEEIALADESPDGATGAAIGGEPAESGERLAPPLMVHLGMDAAYSDPVRQASFAAPAFPSAQERALSRQRVAVSLAASRAQLAALHAMRHHPAA